MSNRIQSNSTNRNLLLLLQVQPVHRLPEHQDGDVHPAWRRRAVHRRDRAFAARRDHDREKGSEERLDRRGRRSDRDGAVQVPARVFAYRGGQGAAGDRCDRQVVRGDSEAAVRQRRFRCDQHSQQAATEARVRLGLVRRGHLQRGHPGQSGRLRLGAERGEAERDHRRDRGVLFDPVGGRDDQGAEVTAGGAGRSEKNGNDVSAEHSP